MVKEIILDENNLESFVKEKRKEMRVIIGDKKAFNALSGGVDSSVVTALAHLELKENLESYFVDTGLMREGEPKYVVDLFNNQLNIPVKLYDASKEFFAALKGKTDPEEKRKAITETFYKVVFGKLVKDLGAEWVLHGTNYTDVEETVGGVKRQHNIIMQKNINPVEEYGYNILEPLEELRKPSVRVLGKYLDLPEEIFARPPFPGPGLSVRVIGEVNPKSIAIVRNATKIVEEILKKEENEDVFQYLAILHNDKVTGVKHTEKGPVRDYGLQIEVRCWNSKDAVTATPTRLNYSTFLDLSDGLTKEIPEVVSVTYNITKKPPSTIEAE